MLPRSGPVLRTLLTIAHLWRLTDDEQQRVLGAVSDDYSTWVRQAHGHGPPTPGSDTLRRISAVLGIYQVLRNLHATDADAVDWLRTLHQAAPFNGRPPVELVVVIG